MYAVAVYVGPKYGRWLIHSARFDTLIQATREVTDYEREELRKGWTPMWRKAVKL